MRAAIKLVLLGTVVSATLGAAAGQAAETGAVRQAGPPWIQGKGAEPVQDQRCIALKLPDAAATKSLNAVSFIDALNGWIVGEKGLCLRTTDGGIHWTVLKLQSKATLRAVEFRADGSGWACGDGDPGAPWPFRWGVNVHFVFSHPMRSSTLLRTSDGGTKWTTTWLPTNFEVPSLAGISKSVIVGTSGGSDHLDGDFIRLDGAANMSLVKGYRAMFALAAVTEDHWIAVGAPVSVGFSPEPTSPLYTHGRCRILLSKTGGKTWQPAEGSEGKGCLRGLAVCGSKCAVAVGDDGAILRSEDRGRSWQPAKHDIRASFLSVAYGADGILVAVGRQGAAAISRDDGRSWNRVEVASHADLRCVSAPAKFFYIVGASGTAIRLLPEAQPTQKNR